MSKIRDESELTDEQKEEVITVLNNLAKIISHEVMDGIEGSERKRFARMFLLEAMDRGKTAR